MGGFLIRRVAFAVFTVWVISVITFMVFYMGQTGRDIATRMAGKNPSEAQITALMGKYALDKSKPTQYLTLMGKILDGSIESQAAGGKPVEKSLAALPVTLSLALLAAALWLAAGVTAGIKGALSPGSTLDRSLMVVALAGISLPPAWISLYALKLGTDTVHVFPPGGYSSIADGGIFQWLWHLLLPASVLAVLFAGVYARMTRTSVRQALADEHVKTAKAKGLPEHHVFVRHVLRTGMIPIVVLFGLDFGLLLGGAIFTETVFGLPGLGSVMMEGINYLDLPQIMTSSIIAAAFVVAANIVVDVVQAGLDPRIRLA